MIVEVRWSSLDPDGKDALWKDSKCLYAYAHPTRAALLYLGKAYSSTPRRRLHGEHKRAVLEYLADEDGLVRLRPFHGGILLPAGCRRSPELIADVESLLIKRLQPVGNTQSRVTRISRSGMCVECTGDWPLKRNRFRDVG